MACNFCLGFCDVAGVRRKNLSMFDGEDLELDQAISRSNELPSSRVAEELRAFFVVEVEYIQLVNAIQSAMQDDAYMFLRSHEFMTVRPRLDVSSLRNQVTLTEDFTYTLSSIELELELRKKSNHRSVDPMLISKISTGAIRETMAAYRRFCGELSILIQSSSSYTPAIAKHTGQLAALALHEGQANVHHFMWLLRALHNINEKETISAWTIPVLFRDSPSG